MAEVSDPKGSLLIGDSTSLAELVSNALFCNRTASIGDRLGGGIVADKTTDRGGWWASPAFGSRLWILLKNGKLTRETPEKCRQYIIEALKSLQDQGVLGSVEVTVTTTGTPTNGVDATIVCKKPNGTPETIRFNDLWTYVR